MFVASAAIWAALGIAGCGGGGGGSTPDPQTSRASLTIQWPTRSRATLAPSSALSAVVRIAGAGLSTGDVVFTINRDTARANGYTAQYSAPTDARIGQFTVIINFYSQADGQGGVVGTVSRVVTLTSGPNSLGDVAVEGTVASAAVGARQTIPTNETSDLVFTAFDASNNAIAGLTPGSAFFTVSAGKQFLDIENGQAKAGATPGVASVIVTVDGKTSAEERVGIGSALSSLTVEGARGTIPLVAAADDFVGGVITTRGAVRTDQSLTVTSNWFYPHTINAPAGYGDRKFDHWALRDRSVSSAPGYNYVPADIAGSLTFTAVYTPRAQPAGGFVPNFSRPEYLHWAQFPVRVYFANPEIDGRLKAGLDKWVAATGGVISYETVSDPSLADITFSLGAPPNGQKGMTTVDFDPGTREILHAEVVLLQSAPGETYPTGVDVLALYAAHEFGHALGITASAEAGSGHSTNPGDTMFAISNASDPFITERDINTLENIYPTLFDGGTVLSSGSRAAQTAKRTGTMAKITVHCP